MLLLACAGFFRCNAQQLTIDFNHPSFGNEGIVEIDFYHTLPDSLGILRSFEITLPDYEKAVYYAQDSFYNYFPVNGNRILPWILTPNTIRDVFIAPAYGVDDEQNQAYKNPGFTGKTRHIDRSGNYMLVSLKDGRTLSMLPLANHCAISDFYITQDGKITLRIANYGTESIEGNIPILAWSYGTNLNESNYNLFSLLQKHSEYQKSIRLRYQKKFPEIFKYLGWCTWEQYRTNMNADLMKKELAKLKKSDVPVRFAILDDCHLTTRSVKGGKPQLCSFVPNKKFPEGFSSLLSMREANGLRWMGLWHNFNGYWGGFSSNNDFGEEIASCLHTIEQTGITMPKVDESAISKVYDRFLGTSAKDGFDFLKVDWQAANIYLNRYSSNAAKAAFLTSRIVDNLAHQYFDNNFINCMAMNNIVLQNTYYVNVTRTSIDYKLNNMFMAKEHLLQSYHNALYMCPTIWGDHDMFHSSDKVCGKIMALSKAMSGGPVYLSDKPDNIQSENITPLCYNDGRIVRPLAPGTVMQRSAFTCPLIERIPYMVSAPLANNAAAIVAYNLCVDTVTVSGKIDATDYAYTGTLIQPYNGKWTVPTEGLYCYDYEAQSGHILKEVHEFEINGFGNKLYYLLPIQKGWVVIGRTDKFLAPATIQEIVYSNEAIELTLEEIGDFDFWMKDGTPYAKGIKITSLNNGLWRAHPISNTNKKIKITKKIN